MVIHKYLIKTPWWLKRIYRSYVWNIPTKEKVLYLSFDDGPHPDATPFVLDELKKYNALATFFCIGKNVLSNQMLYQRIIDEGHTVGNHTMNHVNGWKTDDAVYLSDVTEAAKHIDTSMFRPPYGRITSFQAKNVGAAMMRNDYKIIMWDVLSGDFDTTISKDDCLNNVVLNAREGSIIVFHDSEKAMMNVKYCLPKVLEFFQKKGFRFESLKFAVGEVTKEEK